MWMQYHITPFPLVNPCSSFTIKSKSTPRSAGMAESVVSFVLDHLSQLVAREANLLHGVEDRVQSLQYELQMIKELLSSTRSKKGTEHTVLNQIRDVSHLAQDVIDTS